VQDQSTVTGNAVSKLQYILLTLEFQGMSIFLCFS